MHVCLFVYMCGCVSVCECVSVCMGLQANTSIFLRIRRQSTNELIIIGP